MSTSTLRLDPQPWPEALAQDSAPRAKWKVPRARPWVSTKSRLKRLVAQMSFR